VKCVLDLKSCPTSFDDLPSWCNTFSAGSRSLIAIGTADVIWTIWKTRNDACFRDKYPYDPTGIVCILAHYILVWANFQRQKLQKLQHCGSRLPVLMATEVFYR
jgi:hypothetical protein